MKEKIDGLTEFCYLCKIRACEDRTERAWAIGRESCMCRTCSSVDCEDVRGDDYNNTYDSECLGMK